MPAKIKVYGKAQNRTALGIVHAYMQLHPDATLASLRSAFPNSVCPDSGTNELFLPVAEAEKFNTNISLYFTKPDEIITLADGTDIAMAQVWSKSSLEKLIQRADTLDIEVAEISKTGMFEQGGYRTEYINGYMPAQKKASGKNRWWLWVLLLLLLLGVGAWLFLSKDKTPETIVVEKVVEKEVIKEVIVRDTVYMAQIEDIERNFNAAQFAQGKADLNDDAKLALHDLARVLRQNPQLKLAIEGHTSAEGDAAANQILSENRARAAVDFLVNKEGIEAERLTAVGKGSSEPIDEANLEVNRRTEFVIIEE